jgi:hypothetical protein
MGVNRFAIAGALFATAAAWPWMVGALAGLLLSPYQRALQSSWCGLAPHDSFAMAGHCAACWIGSAVLVLVGLIVLTSKDNIAAEARSIAPRQR